MRTFLLGFIILSSGLYAQGMRGEQTENIMEPEQKLQEGKQERHTTKIYYDQKGNKVEEVWNNYVSDKGKESYLRFKIFYKGNTNIIVKKETYRMGESSPNPKTIDYYDEAQRVYKSESFYPRLTTLKYNRKGRTNLRETLLNERRFYYTDSCSCIEVYDGYFEIQKRILVRPGQAMFETKRTSSEQDLNCKESDC
jgi:hypothetical protein